MAKTVIYYPEACQPTRKSRTLILDDYPWRLTLNEGKNLISDENYAKISSQTDFSKYFSWSALVLDEEPSEESTNPDPNPEPEPEEPTPDNTPPALTLINTAANAAELTPIPGIGTVSAGLIFAARPIDGYASLTAVAAVSGLPGSIDWGIVAAWEPD